MSQQHERCKAEEWHRDGRGMWAMRACAAMEQHGGPHVFLGWTYNVQPPAAEASAVSPEVAQDEQFDGWTPKFTVWLVREGDSWPLLVDSVWLSEADATARAAVRGGNWHPMKYLHLQPPASLSPSPTTSEPTTKTD